jgi:hypothetical protein
MLISFLLAEARAMDQIGNVGASDQHQHTDGRQQKQQWLTKVARYRRRKSGGVEGETEVPGIGVGMQSGQPGSHGREFLRSRCDRNAGLHPPDHVHPSAAEPIAGLKAQRHPQIPASRTVEIGRETPATR